ncbi:hypothetical protein ER57_09895 [Smithella sp. SCADC]|jgi:hypothetical protein|nr:hypothetical protein ER57_09895 [Smithella sp. SCADC]
MKNFVLQLKKLKASGHIVKSEITGKPFFGEVTIIITDGIFDTGDIVRTKESIKVQTQIALSEKQRRSICESGINRLFL